ncbi:hypothetical protein DQ240_10765 [Blastococcus sp. TF02A-26]|nr:hypothetical protein DQ240_10765 [Blastococcus sp. TF02A-26]
MVVAAQDVAVAPAHHRALLVRDPGREEPGQGRRDLRRRVPGHPHRARRRPGPAGPVRDPAARRLPAADRRAAVRRLRPGPARRPVGQHDLRPAVQGHRPGLRRSVAHDAGRALDPAPRHAADDRPRGLLQRPDLPEHRGDPRRPLRLSGLDGPGRRDVVPGPSHAGGRADDVPRIRGVQEDPRDVVARYWDGLWHRRDLAVVDELIGDTYVRHSSAGTLTLSRAEFKREIAGAWRLLHDATTTVDDQIAEGDRVWTRATTQGINLDTGAMTVVTWLTVHRLDGGRIVESWTASLPGVDWRR